MIHMLAYNVRNSFKDGDMQINLDNKPIRLYISLLTSPGLTLSNELASRVTFWSGLREIYRNTL